jgi:CheY-like chemotaxis protein
VKKLYVANANKKKIYLVTDFKTPYTVINTDERFLRQVCNNLLNNAIKYTNDGGVIIEVDEEDHDGKHWLTIKFIDTGIGISEENLKLVFDEFRQVSEGYNREFEGSGLGLHICKRYVDAMGGELGVTSKLGEGSSFIVRLPFDDSPQLQTRVSQARTSRKSIFDETPDRTDTMILLVEDEESNQHYVRHLLKKLKFGVEVASTGQEAVAQAQKTHFDIILMDINLGKDMNGIEAMNIIRKMEGYADVPVVAVTANAMSGHKEEFLAAGFNYYISKPFSMEKLSELINEILSSRA